ncbi:MAG: 3'-5' exonuclease [Bacteroidota bacterium]
MYYLVFDLEMTGTEPGWHEIIQIGAVLYNEEWKELGRYLTNVYPENEESYSIPALEVHGLSMEILEDAPMMNEALPEFEEWILKTMGRMPAKMDGREKGQSLRSVFLCGQSVVNDINFLKFAYRDEHLKWPFSNTLIDLHTLTFFVFPLMKKSGMETPRSRSLESVANFFGYERESEEHNALEDAILTAKCLQKVFEFRDGL